MSVYLPVQAVNNYINNCISGLTSTIYIVFYSSLSTAVSDKVCTE